VGPSPSLLYSGVDTCNFYSANEWADLLWSCLVIKLTFSATIHWKRHCIMYMYQWNEKRDST